MYILYRWAVVVLGGSQNLRLFPYPSRVHKGVGIEDLQLNELRGLIRNLEGEVAAIDPHL